MGRYTGPESLESAGSLRGGWTPPGEEDATRAEAVLAAPVSQLRWAGGYLLVTTVGPAIALAELGLAAALSYGLASADAGPGSWRMLGAAMAQLPAAWVLAGLAAALYGLLP